MGAPPRCRRPSIVPATGRSMLQPTNHGQHNNSPMHIEQLVNTSVEQWWQPTASRLPNHATRQHGSGFFFFIYAFFPQMAKFLVRCCYRWQWCMCFFYFLIFLQQSKLQLGIASISILKMCHLLWLSGVRMLSASLWFVAGNAWISRLH